MNEDRILAELTALRAGQDELGNRLGRLEAGQERLEAGQDQLESSQQQLGAKLERLEAGQDRLRADVMARIDRLADEFAGIRDDMKVTFGSIEHVRRSGEHLREELRGWQDIVATMQRRLMSLSERVSALEAKS